MAKRFRYQHLPAHAPVKVYRNLHKHCLSVVHKGKVVQHASQVLLHNVTFTVSQAGRSRVLSEGRKNVHAFVRGELTRSYPDYVVSTGIVVPLHFRAVTYNPYKYDTFVLVGRENKPIFHAPCAIIIDGLIYVDTQEEDN